MQIPEMEKERLTTQRLVNGWLAIGLVSTSAWLLVQALKFIGSLF